MTKALTFLVVLTIILAIGFVFLCGRFIYDVRYGNEVEYSNFWSSTAATCSGNCKYE